MSSENPAQDFSYFDEQYFQGGNRGTAYVDYLESAKNSNTYRHLAEFIAKVLKPRRCLEIGCATGPIVKRLNDLGVEAHGIDVSDWAVTNRLHPNVSLSSAHALNFPNAHFDLVFSVHALEHLPTEIFTTALRELSRVTEPGGLQFHLMPIIGEPPYVGERSEMIQQLKKDPTHNILEDLPWWIDQWSKEQWEDTGLSAIFSDDTDTFELSSCQFLLKKAGHSFNKTGEVSSWNRRNAEKIFARRTRNEIISVNQNSERSLKFGEIKIWNDAIWSFCRPEDLSNSTLIIRVDNTSSSILDFRVALLDRTDAMSGHIEEWRRFPPGVSLYTAVVRNMALKGEDCDASAITKILFGGSCSDAAINVSLMAPQVVISA